MRSLRPDRYGTNAALALLAALCLLPNRLGAEPAASADAQMRASVEGALRWLATQQASEGPDAGSWPAPKPEYRPATAGLAGLAFLANGHTPAEGEYAAAVKADLRYVLSRQAPDGYFGQGDASGMYIHAICTVFTLSCLGMTGDPELEVALAQRCGQAVRVIVEAQQVRREPTERGGWRYTPYTAESDLSVTSWQLLALHAARQCGYAVDDGVFRDALRYLDQAYVEIDAEHAGYVYRPGISTKPEPSLTGTALFVRSILEPDNDVNRDKLLRFLDGFPPAWGGEQYRQYFFFASFYMAQGMFQTGGETWTRYRQAMGEVLLSHQAGDGHWPFPPDNAPQSRLAGPAYPTAMAVLILSLDRQFLPMYQRRERLF